MFFRKVLGCPLAILLELSTVILFPVPIMLFAALSQIFPIPFIQKKLVAIVEAVARAFGSVNDFILCKLLGVKLTVLGKEKIPPNRNYFVIANHQSWVDILILEAALSGVTGASRYFIKKNLLHIPLLGWACRALHFPYMYRFTKEHLAKHPEDKGKDVAITKKSCQKLLETYFKLNNFPEGTRNTPIKHQRQQSPYRNLLRPKSGGIAHALQILHKQLACIIDVTIVYAEKPNILKLFFGQMTEITVVLKTHPIDATLIGNYEEDRPFRAQFQTFISKIWEEKDQLITKIKTQGLH